MGARAFRSPLCSKHFFMGNPDYAAADDGDDSSEATRLRSLILAAADSTINQTIQLRSDALATAPDTRNADLLQFIEERRQKALLMIAKMRKAPQTGSNADAPW
jgi:hypothetical protein